MSALETRAAWMINHVQKSKEEYRYIDTIIGEHAPIYSTDNPRQEEMPKYRSRDVYERITSEEAAIREAEISVKG